MPNNFTKFRRQFTDYFFTGLAAGMSVLVVGTLLAIFAYLALKGAGSLNWAFLMQTPKPVGEAGGGMANALIGSVMILGIASLLGVPVGIGAGIYLAEFGRNRLGQLVRFTADVLNGVPSIVIGLVAYGLVVVHAGVRPHRWRNCATVVHRFWKPVLEFQRESAYRGFTAADLYVCHFAV